jgi:hypothetical protein
VAAQHGFGGPLSVKSTVNAEPGTVPFVICFDPFGHLVIAQARPNALATFDLSRPERADHAARSTRAAAVSLSST